MLSRLQFLGCASRGCLVAMMVLALPVAAQQADTQPATTQPSEGPTTLTPEDVQARLTRAEGDQSLPENTRVETVNLYRQALEQLGQAETWRQKADEYRKGRENVPALLEEVRARLKQLNEASAEPLVGDVPTLLEDLSRKLTGAEADLKAHQDSVRRLDDEAQQRTERRSSVPDLLAAAMNRQETASRGLAETPGASVAPQIQLARRTLLTAQRLAAQEETRAYQEELQYYDSRNDVLALRRDEARTRATQSEARVAAWRSIVAEAREAASARQREEAEVELRRTPEAIRELAKENGDLAKEWDELGPRIKVTEEEAQDVKKLLESLTSQFNTLQSYGESEEMADLVGPLMRKQRTHLTRLRRYERDLEQTRSRFARTQYRISEIDAENSRLLNLNQAVDRQMEELSFVETAMSDEELAGRLEDLLRTRLDTIKKLIRDYDAYATDLIELAAALSSLNARVDQMSTFIAEHVLWVRSAAPIHRMKLELDLDATRGAVVITGRTWWMEVQQFWWIYALAAVVYAVFIQQQPRLRRDLLAIGELVSKPFSDKYSLTLRAVFDTLAIALPAPALLWFVGWRLVHLDVATEATAFDFARSAAEALSTTGTVLFVLLVLRHICRRHGVAANHFRWHTKGLSVFRRHLIWFAPMMAPLVFLVVATERYADPTLSSLLGRFAFLAAVAITIVFVRQALHPERGAFSHYLAKRDDTLIGRLSWTAYFAALLILIGLAVASAMGYHYTAIELSSGLIVTLILTSALILLHALATRWVIFTQRKLAIEEARRRRAEATSESREKSEAVAPDVGLDDDSLNIGAIGGQTRQLLSSFAALGVVVIIWFSWADLLPALSFLKDVTLWSYTQEVPVMGDGAAGRAISTTVVESITLANVLLALLMLVVAFILARNMPGLLEIALLRRLPLDSGARFAISTVSRYAITLVGLLLAFGAIGIGWSKVQWLMAAITVGLGFGLQEIFANFVSGLILLFERPIRIGDTVTVGDISGTVTRIRIRATTITDWDRKELVIPNKEFVTGQVVNWSLSDRLLRLVIRVGIAYGSDVQGAKRILLDIANKNPRILEQPKPQVWFWEFGESSLNFEIRGFVKDIDDWVLTRDSLHFEIDAAFRKAGIEIAFPQRDIHVRSIQQALSINASEAAENLRPLPQENVSH